MSDLLAHLLEEKLGVSFLGVLLLATYHGDDLTGGEH